MQLIDFLDKGAMLGADAPCLSVDDQVLSYAQVQGISNQVARVLQSLGVTPGSKVAVLSGNDPVALACVFGISRAGAVWCPMNPRSGVEECHRLLDALDCRCLLFHSSHAIVVEQIRSMQPELSTLVCIDQSVPFAPSLRLLMQEASDAQLEASDAGDLAMIAETGGTTGKPKRVMLSNHNLECMSALMFMNFPFVGRPVYLALAPLTHSAGIFCLPMLALGGCIIVMAKPDLVEFLCVIPLRRITHTFLPPVLLERLLQFEQLAATDLSSLQCFWYGGASIAAPLLEQALRTIGPVMGQVFGQIEAPMAISMMAPQDHFNSDGSVARNRLTSVGRPGHLLRVGILDQNGQLLPTDHIGEIVVRGALVMLGYYNDVPATKAATRFSWHHTGDLGYIDSDGFLYVVDRAADAIVIDDLVVHSIQVESALCQHPDVLFSAVVGVPDQNGEMQVVAVVQLRPDVCTSTEEDLTTLLKAHLGSVSASVQVQLWSDLPRSKNGKVLKNTIRESIYKSQMSAGH